MPSNLVYVDTEANIEKKDDCQLQTFRLGYAIHSRNGYLTGFPLKDISDFWDLLDDFRYDGTRLHVFAHNMAYDYAILKLDTYISERKLEVKLRAIDRVFIVNAGNLSFLSSTNYYRQSLKELGIMFGLSKMDSPDFENVSDAKLMEYCQRDTEVLAKIIQTHIAFLKSNNLGNFMPTIAGQAMTAFRHRFMQHDILVHDFQDILEMASRSYRGGRCETFRIGKFNDIYKLDINSMYPFIMKTCQYPIRPLSTKPVQGCSISDLEESSEKNFVIADCDMILREPAIATKREKLFFPIGNLRQTILQPEIEMLLKNPSIGEITKVHSMVSYRQADIFSTYVDFFYGLRCNSDNPAIKQMCKIMLNSLYGKMGQRNSTKPELVTDIVKSNMLAEIMTAEGTSEIHDGLKSKYVRLGTDIYHVTGTGTDFATESIPEIASAVTAYSRCLLYRMIMIAGWPEILYCDTDSVFTTKTGYENLENAGLVHASELGKLKVEEIGNVELFGAKDYVFNSKAKLKGIKHSAERLPDGSYRQFQFQTKHTRYRNGTPDGIVITVPIIKHLSRRYDKGVVSGQSVRPLVFSDF
jgi:hypothetical protein